MDAYTGQIILFGGNYAPPNWHICDGSLLQISDYNVLFSLISTTYGGDGASTFGLPDLRSRTPIAQGQGPGLTDRVLGQSGGAENVGLTIAQIPQHTHRLNATTAAASTNVPSPTVMLGVTPGGAVPNGTVFYFNPPASGAPTPAAMASNEVLQIGGNGQHKNVMPYSAVNFLICLNGLYPSRN